MPWLGDQRRAMPAPQAPAKSLIVSNFSPAVIHLTHARTAHAPATRKTSDDCGRCPGLGGKERRRTKGRFGACGSLRREILDREWQEIRGDKSDIPAIPEYAQ